MNRTPSVTPWLLVAAVLANMAAHPAFAQGDYSMISRQVDWPAFMGRLDPVWDVMPTHWWQAPFLGNGLLGIQVRQTDGKEVRWNIGHATVEEQRPSKGALYGRCRLPIGDFVLRTAGKITGGDMRMDLWNAEATGTIRTEAGEIAWRSYVHSERMAIVTELRPSGGEADTRLAFEPAEAVSPRRKIKDDYKNYEPNPDPTISDDGAEKVCVQPLKKGIVATAWRQDDRDGKRVLVASVAQSVADESARAETLAAVREAWATPLDRLDATHRAWWHAFYPESFLTLPDTRWESFYWLQIYKLASATRADRALIDNQGPWLQPTPWPASWWNLNVQLTYWPTYDSNRLHLGESLVRHLDKYRDNLKQNVQEPYRQDSIGIARAVPQDLRGGVGVPSPKRGAEIGNLPWALHNVYLHYRHAMDEQMLRDVLYPLLKESINYYFHFLKEGDDGKLHLERTYSPEYGDAPDCNYDLALLRWGCQALIELSDRLGIDDRLEPKWRNVLENLTDYPTNENGFMIGAGEPFAQGHRHFSHLLMVYPLHLVNLEQSGTFDLVDKTVRHWHSLGHQAGYSWTGAASIYAAYGKAEQALEKLNGLRNYIQPNTLYKEAGPVIETPLHAAQCLHEFLLQSWGGTIRVFPAVSSSWKDVAFDDLRAQGAFLVSAKRQDGKTQFVRLKSLAGEPCVVRTDLEDPIRAEGPQGLEMTKRPDGAIELNLAKGQEAVLYSGAKPELAVAPVEPEANWLNPYGLKPNRGDHLFAYKSPVSARYVRIMLPGEERILSLAEVKVYSGEKNVALKRQATQSSEANGGKAERGVDGNTSGEWKHNSVTHTKETTANPWWEVDLGKDVPIDRVSIWNRSILKERLDGFRLILIDAKRNVVRVDATDSDDGEALKQSIDSPIPLPKEFGGLSKGRGDYWFPFDTPRAARYVRIELPGEKRTLSLAEVEVFSGGNNVATLGKASQSSTMVEGKAERAIDGNTDGFWKHDSVTHTALDKPEPWWELDLGAETPIDGIAVWNRDYYQERLEGFRLILLDDARKEVWRGGDAK